MKKFCSMILALAACLMLTVPALAAETGAAPGVAGTAMEAGAAPAVAGTDTEVGVGYAMSPWVNGYTYAVGPWINNASYVVRPWEGNYTYVATPNGSGYVYSPLWTGRAEGMGNFQRVRTYTSGTYKDVPAGAWYEEGVRTLYERGLLGDSEKFRPKSGMTLGEVVSLAVRIHSIYNNWSIPSGMSELQYALNVGIVTPGQYDNYSDMATRRSFAAILSKALPTSALRGINSVLDGAIPDVPANDPGAWGIYTLYRAGVLWKNNDWGSFAPNQRITRDSAAVIAARLVDPSQRKTGSMTVLQPVSVSLSQSTMSLYPGESRTLAAYVYPVGAVNQSVHWISSNYSVASVDSYGTVTAYRPGTAIITATTPAGTVAACTVHVSSWY